MLRKYVTGVGSEVSQAQARQSPLPAEDPAIQLGAASLGHGCLCATLLPAVLVMNWGKQAPVKRFLFISCLGHGGSLQQKGSKTKFCIYIYIFF